MRVLIFTLLALAVNATNYGYSGYYSGYPSYSYGSYPSYGSYGGYGSYGSSLYGATYGSGLGYGSGYGYGVGGLASYTAGYKPAVYQTARQPVRAVHKSGPGKIEFVLGDTGYQTGTQVLSDARTPVAPRPAGIFSHGGSSLRRSGGVAPARISFTQGVSRVSGQSGLHRSGVSAFAPQSPITEEHSRVHGGSLPRSQVSGGVSFQESHDLTGAGIAGEISPKPFTGSHGFSAVHKSGTTLGSAGPQISFTRDTSRVAGGVVGSRPQIHSFEKVSAPLGAAVIPKIPSRSVGITGALHKSEVHADHPRITYTQDFSKVSGQSQKIGAKPDTRGFVRSTFPVVGTVEHHESGHDIGSEHTTETHGTSDAGGYGETDPTEDTAGVSGIHTTGVTPTAVSSGRFSSSGMSSLPRPSSGSRITGARPNVPSQAFPGEAGPARITFTQDFSRVASAHDGLTAPAFPGAVASQGYQAARRNTAAKFASPLGAKPIQRTPSFTSVYNQSPARAVFPVRSDAGDKSIFADGPITDYGHDGLKISNLVVIPGAAHDKSSAFKHSTVAGGRVSGVHHSTVGARDHLVVPSYGMSFAGEPVDKPAVFVAVPAEGYGDDKSSVLLHSTEVAPTGSFVSSGVDSALPIQGQAQGYNALSSPLKSHFSSSYPGYSHISGESPRYEFSHDRSLLYTYNSSPSLISPFSYSTTSGNKYYGQGGRKTVA